MFSAWLKEKQQLSSSSNASELHQHVVATITTSATRASRQLTAVAQKMACQH